MTYDELFPFVECDTIKLNIERISGDFDYNFMVKAESDMKQSYEGFGLGIYQCYCSDRFYLSSMFIFKEKSDICYQYDTYARQKQTYIYFESFSMFFIDLVLRTFVQLVIK